jgi:Uma2 family endonuclease
MLRSDAKHERAELPAVDERLVAPEVRYEIHDGELVHVSPAHEPHGTLHSKLAALVEAHAGSEFSVAVDMLTRTSETSDVAPDVSVFPRARDRQTGGRQIEQLAFEIVSTESLGHAGGKAAKLSARGVRRVFAIDVERSRALEWSTALATWSVLEPSAHIVDPALAVPLPIAALLREAKADDAVARALIVKRNPEIEAMRAQDRREASQDGLAQGLLRGRIEGKQEGRIEGKQEGRVEGKAEALLVMLAARGISIDRAARDRILGEPDPVQLDRWITRAAICSRVAEIFAER